MSSTPDPPQANTPLVLTFHKLSPTFTWGATNFAPRRFRSLLQLLQDRGYQFPGDYPSQTSKSIQFTFDDGYRHLLDTLPAAIEQFGLRPVIFIPTGWLGKSNSWDYCHYLRKDPHLSGGEVKELASLGGQFGSHGHSHTDLGRCSPDKLAAELRDSRQCLEDLLGQPVISISYPFGGVNERVVSAAATAGYQTGFTMRFPRTDDSPLAQGRCAVYGFDTTFAILQKIEQGRLYEVERIKGRIINGLSGGTRLLNRLRGQV